MCGQQFGSNDEVTEVAELWFGGKQKKSFKKGIGDIEERWRAFIAAQGMFVYKVSTMQNELVAKPFDPPPPCVLGPQSAPCTTPFKSIQK